MSTTISNPASFSSVRAACTAEGYGSSANFSAYTRGGGIVPNNANTAGIATVASSLRLSQFSGVTILRPVHTLSASGSFSGSFSDSIAPPSTVGGNTNSVTITQSGGVGPFTYSWAYLSGDNATINSPSAATTSLNTSGLAADPALVKNGVFRCTVTDTGNGNQTATIDVNFTASFFYAGP